MSGAINQTFEDSEIIFRKSYENGDGDEQTCSLRLRIDKENNTVQIRSGKTEKPDKCNNQIPLWRNIADLIYHAIDYAEKECSK